MLSRFERLIGIVVFLVLIGGGIPVSAQDAQLKVLSLFPDGNVSKVTQFTATFDQAMAPLGDMNQEAATSPMVIDPPLEGQFRWLNPYTLVFEPTSTLVGSRAGTVRIKAGTKSLAGAVLAEDVTAKFSLPELEIVRTSPSIGTRDLELTPEIRVDFNQPLDPDLLASRGYFQVSSTKTKIPLKVVDSEKVNQNRQPGSNWAAIITPAQALQPDTDFELIIPEGMASLAGPLKSKSPMTALFRTYGPLTVTEITGYRPREDQPLDPESGLSIRFSNPVPIKDLAKYIKIVPEYDLSGLNESDFYEEESQNVWLPGAFKPSTTYRITFLKQIKDVFGQSYSGKKQYLISFGPTRPVLDLPGRDGVLEASDHPRFPFQARNLKKVKVRGCFLSPDNIVPFIIQNKMYRYTYQSTEDFLAGDQKGVIRRAQINLNNPPDVMTWEPVDIKRLFGSSRGPGLMYVDLNAPETNQEEQGKPVYRRALVQVTDVGLAVKFGLDNTLIWTTDLEKGTSLAGVQLEIRNPDNKVLWQGQTDDQGLAVAPGSVEFKVQDRKKESWGEPELFVLARHDQTLSVVSNDWDDGISPWNFGLSGQELDRGQEELTWVLTSLPLYKPGDEVRFKLIRRTSTATGLAAIKDEKLRVVIQDSRGETVQEMELQGTRFGTASGSFALSDTASLGHYSVQIGPDKERMRYCGSFQVEAYRKPTFAVTVTPSAKEGYVGEAMSAKVQADYHFGSPVREQPIKYSVTAGPTGYKIPGYEDYSVVDTSSDPEAPYEEVSTISEGEGKLNDSGSSGIDFTATAGKKGEVREFTIEATVTDVDQRTVSQRTSLTVHPAAFYIGLFSKDFLIKSGDKIDVKLIAATPDGKLLADKEADLVLFKRTWQTVRRKGVGGYYEYVCKAQDEMVEKLKVTTGTEPKVVSITVPGTGYYYVAAGSADDQGRVMSATVDFYGYGGGAAGWEHYDHDRIDLVLDQKDYRPGQKATIMVKSPFSEGTGLLTVERQGVRHQELFPIDGPAPTLTLDITPEDAPNVFVSVLLVRGRISDKLDKAGKDPGKPAFKVGYAEIKVLDDSNKLKVKVSADRAEFRPGEKVRLDLEVKDAQGRPQSCEVALIVADAALLQLASENVYYPEKLFFSDRPLGVWTSDLRLNLIGRRHFGLKGANPGGGGLGAEESKFRKKFLSLAFFDPHVLTDEQGKATATFTLPDNLTTFKIFAVANDDASRFGTGVNSILVTTPLLIKPALPNFTGVGDDMTAGVVVHNRSRNSGPVKISLAGQGFTIKGSGEQEVNLAADSSVEVGFPVTIIPGSKTVFQYKVAMDRDRDAAEFSLPVRYPNALKTSAAYGRWAGSVKETVLRPKDADPNRGDLTIQVTPSLVGTTSGALDYLDRYPHRCLEQQISMAQADLFRLTWKDRLGMDKKQEIGLRDRIRKLLDRLPGFQTYQGGFTFWNGQSDPDPFLSVYVMEFLLKANKTGFSIDKLLDDRGRKYLTQLLNFKRWPRYYGEKARLTTTCYAVAVLAETGSQVAPSIELIYAKRKDLDPFNLSLLLRSLVATSEGPQSRAQIKEVIKLLFNRAVFASGEVYFEEKSGLAGLMASRVRTNAFVLRALLAAEPNGPHVVPLARWLVMEQKEGSWGSTQGNAAVLVALSDYMETLEQTPPDFHFEAVLDGNMALEGDFKSFDAPKAEAQIPPDRLAPGTPAEIDLNLIGQGHGYYALSFEWAKKAPDLEAQSNGLILTRTFRKVGEKGALGPERSQFDRGDLVQVDITILVPNQRHWVVMEDWLPAGLEPINFNLPVAPGYLKEMLNKGQRPEEYFRRYWFDHHETRSQMVTAYARALPPGAYTFTYLARAVVQGRFVAPGPRAYEMYAPETSGQGQGVMFEIKDAKGN